METQTASKHTVAPFRRLVVGIDSSPESLEAARQAARLAEGPVSLVAAYDLAPALVGGVAPAALPCRAAVRPPVGLTKATDK